MTARDTLARVELRLAKTGKTAREASIESGQPDRIQGLRRRVARGEGEGDVHENTLRALAKPLKTTAEWLDKEEGPEELEAEEEPADELSSVLFVAIEETLLQARINAAAAAEIAEVVQLAVGSLRVPRGMTREAAIRRLIRLEVPEILARRS